MNVMMSGLGLKLYNIFKYVKTRRKITTWMSFLMLLYLLYICSDQWLSQKSVSNDKSDANLVKSASLSLPNLVKRHLSINMSHITLSPERLTTLIAANTALTQNLQILIKNETQSDRKKLLDHFCRKYGLKHKILTIWRKSSNEYKGRHRFCSTKSCPILVDERHKFQFCFVQKIGSTSAKKLFTTLSANQTKPPNETTIANITAFHITANDVMSRISPMYYSTRQNKKYFKAIFVRHPFLRLISVFKDKAEKNRTEEPFFYAKYWDRIMRLERGNQSVTNDSKPLFKEFIKLLLISKSSEFDEHWAPIWTRCEPCYVDYDFIGKLETPLDFESMQSHIRPKLKAKQLIWENRNQNHSSDSIRREAKKYFLQISGQQIIALYKIYFLDFKLFGYTIEEIFQ